MSEKLSAPAFVVLIAVPAWTMEQAARIKKQFEQMHVGTVADIAENKPAPPPEAAKVAEIAREVVKPREEKSVAELPAPVVADPTAPVSAPIEAPFAVGDRLRDKYAPGELDVINVNLHSNHFTVQRVSEVPVERTVWPVPFASADCFEKIFQAQVGSEPGGAAEDKSSAPSTAAAPSGAGEGSAKAHPAPKVAAPRKLRPAKPAKPGKHK